MTRHLMPLATVVLLASLAACASNEPAVTPNAEATPTPEESRAGALIERDLVYAHPTWDGEAQTLDLYVPPDPAGAPVVITTDSSVWPGLVKEGVIVAHILNMETNSPDTDDVVKDMLSDHGAHIRATDELWACAIHYARARASELGSTDPVVGLTGFSGDAANAARAALMGTTIDTAWDEFAASGGPSRQIECEVTEGSTHVDALVGISGPYAVTVPVFDDLGGYGRTYLQELDPELQAFLATAIGASPDLKVRLLHGTADTTIPFENSPLFQAVLTEAGYDVDEVIPYTGGHQPPPGELSVPVIMDALG
jgi:hypothetical protein